MDIYPSDVHENWPFDMIWNQEAAWCIKLIKAAFSGKWLEGIGEIIVLYWVPSTDPTSHL